MIFLFRKKRDSEAVCLIFFFFSTPRWFIFCGIQKLCSVCNAELLLHQTLPEAEKKKNRISLKLILFMLLFHSQVSLCQHSLVLSKRETSSMSLVLLKQKTKSSVGVLRLQDSTGIQTGISSRPVRSSSRPVLVPQNPLRLLCLEPLVPVRPSWWGLSSEPAASGPWHLGCGWWRSRTSWSWAGGAWRRSACAWSSVWSCTGSPGPWTRRRSRYSSELQETRRNQVGPHSWTQRSDLYSIPLVCMFLGYFGK